MYCAKCGSELSLSADGYFVCPRGLDFSLAFSRALRDHYPSATRRRGDASHDGRLFCPGCGETLEKAEQECGRCGVRLSPSMLYQLIEFHPHPDGRGGYF